MTARQDCQPGGFSLNDHRRVRGTGRLTLAAALSLAAGTADAQDAPRTTESADGTIVVTAPRYVPKGSVTASKSDIPLIQTPQSVSVVTRDQIDLLNLIDGQQAVRYTAGVFGENYGPDLRFDFLTVRGFTPKQYIDGLAAPVSTTIYSVGVDLYAFDSLELLKGPASALYGNAPPGGLYNLVSRRASPAFGGEATAQYGTDDYKTVQGTVTGPVGGGIDVRLTGLYRDRDSERDLVSARRVLAAPTVTFKPAPGTTITALGYHQSDTVRGDTNGFLPVQGTLLPNPNGEIGRSTNLGDPRNLYRREQWAVGWDASQALGAVTLRSNTKWSHYHEWVPIGVYGGGGLVNTTNPALPSYYRTVARYNFSARETVGSFATDNRAEGTLKTGGLTHKLLAGVDYRNVDNDAAFGFVFDPAPIDLYNPVYGAVPTLRPGYPTAFNDQRVRQAGVYVQDQIRSGDFYLTLGARQDWVKVDNRLAGAKDDQDKFTWRAGATYVSDGGVAPYISYATSFEPVLGTDSVTGDAFRPSSGRQIEGGVKFDARGLGDGVTLFATAAVFDIRQTNVVSTLPSVTPVFGTQSGEVEVYGGELELVARIRDRLTINASYSYNHSEVTESATAAEVGSPLPTTPRHKLSMLVDYTRQTGALAGFGGGLGGRYTSRSAGSLPGAFNPVVYYGEGATLLDAILHYDTPGWRFAVNGSNILDRKYVARCSGVAGCNFGAGRQVIASVTKTF